MTPAEIRLLYDYNSWANHRALDACAALTTEQFTCHLGSSFSSVRDTLAHIMGGEWVWLERWHGRLPTSLPSAEQYADLASVRANWGPLERDLLDFVAGLTPDDLARTQTIRTTAGVPYTHPLWQMLQHLANHGTYHRGQLTTLLRQLGAKPTATDLIAFYRERAAQASA